MTLPIIHAAVVSRAHTIKCQYEFISHENAIFNSMCSTWLNNKRDNNSVNNRINYSEFLPVPVFVVDVYRGLVCK